MLRDFSFVRNFVNTLFCHSEKNSTITIYAKRRFDRIIKQFLKFIIVFERIYLSIIIIREFTRDRDKPNATKMIFISFKNSIVRQSIAHRKIFEFISVKTA